MRLRFQQFLVFIFLLGCSAACAAAATMVEPETAAPTITSLPKTPIVIERPTTTATAAPPTEAPFTDLNGTQWDLIAYGAPDRPVPILPNTQPTAEFLDGQVTGTTGCNQYSAPFSQSGSTLTTGPVSSTRRACAEAVGQQEAEILQGWDTAVAYQLGNDTLTIQHEKGVLVFVAATAVQPETVEATAAAPETILLLAPANGSRVTSPVTLSGESDFPFEGTLSVEIVTLEGASVGRGFAMLAGSAMGQRGPFHGEVAFTPPDQPRPGRIQVSMISPRDGHIEHLASAIVTLLPDGDTPDVQTADSQPEAIAIYSPAHFATASGSSVQIIGFAAPTFEQNLVIEILDGEGRMVGNSFTTIAGSMGEWGPFVADVAYTITAETPGAVCVQDISAADGSLVHRNCVAVTLLP